MPDGKKLEEAHCPLSTYPSATNRNINYSLGPSYCFSMYMGKIVDTPSSYGPFITYLKQEVGRLQQMYSQQKGRPIDYTKAIAED